MNTVKYLVFTIAMIVIMLVGSYYAVLKPLERLSNEDMKIEAIEIAICGPQKQNP